MIYYVLRDIVPFAFFGAIVVVNFAIALFVLIGRSYQTREKNEEDPEVKVGRMADP